MITADSVASVVAWLRRCGASPLLGQPGRRPVHPSPAYAGPGGRTTPQADDDFHVMQAITEALRSEVGSMRAGAKLVARDAKASPRTAKGWLRGESAPQAAKLIALMARYDSVFDAVLELAGRKRPGEMSAAERELIARALRILDQGSLQ